VLTASDVMRTEVWSVSPDLGLVELERQFLAYAVQGFPVVEDGRLVGIVSRSDIVRSRSIAREYDEHLSDFYRAFDSSGATASEPDPAASARVGERTDGQHVSDAMIRKVITVARDQPLTEVAQLMLDRHIHRLPVVDADGALIGIITTLDVVRLVADGRVVVANPE
jgi:CBS domain-containing protein